MTVTGGNRQSGAATQELSPRTNKVPGAGRARQALIQLRSSFWFLPVVIIVAAMGLALGLVELDRHVDEALMQWSPQWFRNEPEGARSILQAIAGSMATVAGVVFSITIVALTLASTQYTSRIMRNFMRDRLNQSMLGIFIGVYLYSLLVLRVISGGDGVFVPSLALLAAVVLAVLASATFVIFIHHIASSIQASELARAIAAETMAALDTEFHPGATACQEDVARLDPAVTWQPVSPRDVGYIQTVDKQALLDFACAHDTIVRMECGVGDFVAPGWAMVSIAGLEPASEQMIEEINRIYAVDSYRTIDQDVAFGFRELVDIALKSLSPAINDTTTAVTCIEYLSALLRRCAPRLARARRHFQDGALRVIAHPRSFAYLVSLAFDQILENAKGNTEILLRLMSAIEKVAGSVHDAGRVATLEAHLDAIAETVESADRTASARRRLNEKLTAVRQVLDARRSAAVAGLATH